MRAMAEKFIIVTEAGGVLVSVNPEAGNGLDPHLLQLGVPSDADRAEAAFETPLRAFSAKMVDLIKGAGFEGVPVSGQMLDMLIREKAASDLARIERWARDNLG